MVWKCKSMRLCFLQVVKQIYQKFFAFDATEKTLSHTGLQSILKVICVLGWCLMSTRMRLMAKRPWITSPGISRKNKFVVDIFRTSPQILYHICQSYWSYLWSPMFNASTASGARSNSVFSKASIYSGNLNLGNSTRTQYNRVTRSETEEAIFRAGFRPYAEDKRIVFNVSGCRFETWESTLKRYPNTVLGSKMIHRFYDEEKNEYFIDRDPYLFKFILNFYRRGKLHCSLEDCPAAFEEELNFYGLSVFDVDDCCWELATPKEKHHLVEDDEEMPGEVIKCDGNTDVYCEPKFTLKQKIWRTIGPAKTTRAGVLFHIIYGIFIFINVLIVTLETLQCEKGRTCGEVNHLEFFTVDTICVAVFTTELILRFYVCPKKRKFFKEFLNIIDLLSVLPYYLSLIIERLGKDSSFLQILKVLRVLRILKLTRNSRRLRCLLLTLRRCAVDIIFLYCICVLAIILFGTTLYYLQDSTEPRQFSSIPESFWYILVTLMTVG